MRAVERHSKRSNTMAYSLACADSGAKCPGKFVAETEKELMDHVKMHMGAAHPEMMKNPPAPETLKKLVKQV
jgi:predicted small metal-binding protein